MITGTETIIVNGSKEAIEDINRQIEELVGSQTLISERRNLDGDTATWIVIATLASQSLPHILNFIKEYVSSKKVKKIKIGDLEVENPTKEMIVEYEKLIKSRLNDLSSNG